MLGKVLIHCRGAIRQTVVLKGGSVFQGAVRSVYQCRVRIATMSPLCCLPSRPFSATVAAGDAEMTKWLNTATTGDAESAFQLGVLLHKREIEKGRAAHAAAAATQTEGKSEGGGNDAAAQVIKEIKQETRSNLKARKERFALKKAADPAAVTVSSAKDTWQFWMRKAARAGHSTALVYLGNQLLHGKVDELGSEAENIAEAAACYEQAAAAVPPHADALFNLGTLLFSGAEDSTGAQVIPADVQRSFHYFSGAAKSGDAGAQYWVGHCLLSGEGGAAAVDVNEGIDLMQKAAKAGHPAALYYMATAYRAGLAADEQGHSLPANKPLFLMHLEMAVAAQEADALFCMADLYLQGAEGYPIDERKALFYLELAAEQKQPDALTTLGVMHYSGRGGLPADKRKAFELYNQAGELGSVQAWKNLAMMHFTGDGVPKSEEIAREIMKHLGAQPPVPQPAGGGGEGRGEKGVTT